MKHWSEDSQDYTLISFFVIHMWLLWSKDMLILLPWGSWRAERVWGGSTPTALRALLPGGEELLFNHSINLVYDFVDCGFKIFFNWSAESWCMDVSSTSEFSCDFWDVCIFWSHWTFDTVSFFSDCHCDFGSADFLDYSQSISCLFVIYSVIL